MKKLPPQSLDLGLEELIQEKKKISENLETSAKETFIEDSSSEISTLFLRGEFAKVISRTEGLFSVDPESAIYWIRSQSALGAVPLSILIAPFEKAIYEMLSKDSSLHLKSLAGYAAEEFISSEHLDDEFKQRIADRMLELGIELPKNSASGDSAVFNNQAAPSPLQPKKKSHASSMILILMLLIGVILYQLIDRYNPEASFQYASVIQPEPSKDLISGDLKRQSVGSLDALLSDLNNKPSEVQPINSPITDVVTEASPIPVQPKETVNTDSPVEPTNLRRSDRDEPPEPRLKDEYNDGFYEVLVETLVLTKPQIDSAPVTRLRPGALLEVVRRDGVFYEVKSKGGKIGYVLMQDVAPPGVLEDRSDISGTNRREFFRNKRLVEDDSNSPPDPFSRESVERRYER